MTSSCHKEENKEPLKNIGDLYGGGIIFDRVLYNSWINGKSESCIYSIAALSDLPDSLQWGCMGVRVPFDNNTTDGFTGRHHTIIIAENCPEPGIAAKICRSTTLNGCNDWWLPSNIELTVMYYNRDKIGGFTNGIYWSGDEFDSCNVFCFNFGMGVTGFSKKDRLLHVRPVRAVQVDFN